MTDKQPPVERKLAVQQGGFVVFSLPEGVNPDSVTVEVFGVGDVALAARAALKGGTTNDQGA